VQQSGAKILSSVYTLLQTYTLVSMLVEQTCFMKCYLITELRVDTYILL